jgi:hypothetical protein
MEGQAFTRQEGKDVKIDALSVCSALKGVLKKDCFYKYSDCKFLSCLFVTF